MPRNNRVAWGKPESCSWRGAVQTGISEPGANKAQLKIAWGAAVPTVSCPIGICLPCTCNRLFCFCICIDKAC